MFITFAVEYSTALSLGTQRNVWLNAESGKLLYQTHGLHRKMENERVLVLYKLKSMGSLGTFALAASE